MKLRLYISHSSQDQVSFNIRVDKYQSQSSFHSQGIHLLLDHTPHKHHLDAGCDGSYFLRPFSAFFQLVFLAAV